MSKQERLKNIATIITPSETKFIRIYIAGDPPKLYKMIPAGGDLDLIALDAEDAKEIYDSLSLL